MASATPAVLWKRASFHEKNVSFFIDLANNI